MGIASANALRARVFCPIVSTDWCAIPKITSFPGTKLALRIPTCKCMPLDVRRQLDSIPRLTDDINLHSGATYNFLAPPFLYDYPQYFTSGRLPNGVGGFGEEVWWEHPIWWAGIVRARAWRPSDDFGALASHLRPSHVWKVLESPVDDILWKPDSALHLGDLIQ